MPARRRRPGLFPRRRPLRRPLMQGRPAVPPVVQQALRRAHQHMASGEYDAAIAIYKRLAAEAYKRGRVRPGAQMELESARVQLISKQFDAAKESVLHALEMLLSRNIVPGVIMPVVDRICGALQAGGEEQAADIFRANINQLLSTYGFSPEDLRQPMISTGTQVQDRKKLPELCPSCFAPVHADEVVWTEPGRTQCTYCGRPISVE